MAKQLMMEIRHTGIVKWWSASKGYGFIAADGQGEGPDIFVHYSAIKKSGYKALVPMQRVEFTIQKVERGLQAYDVAILGDPLPEQVDHIIV
jgi:CspA family cold shock protein